MRPHRTLPTDANLRFHRRLLTLAIGLFLLMCLIVGNLMTAGGGGSRGPMGLVSAGIAFVGAIALLWHVTATLRRGLRQLASRGRRFAAERVGTDLMQRGEMTHWHVVVAQWRDERGTTHEALSDPFDYDPSVLLDRSQVQVLADPFEPTLCLVASDRLPPTQWRRLDAAQRARVNAHTPLPPALLQWLRRLLILIAIGALGYALLTLATIIWGWPPL